ncbi:hypothetical protein BD408DRAFT_136657 [Parasitella parasitica]|nr:hypothetical protein BD408DRAFT_136657 [Parasitella parasitica]
MYKPSHFRFILLKNNTYQPLFSLLIMCQLCHLLLMVAKDALLLLMMKKNKC